MALKLGIFTTATFPYERGDMLDQALENYMDLADEVVTMKGEDSWPKEFDWRIIGEHFQRGYEELNTDWVIHADLDFFFHERDFKRIREAILVYNDQPAITFLKYQFIQPDRYTIKSRLVLAVNKKFPGIRFNSGGDLCQPSIMGVEIKPNLVPDTKIPVYNYEKLIKTSDQVMDDVGRMDRAYRRHFNKKLYGDGSDEDAFNGWMKMMIGRYNKPNREIKITEHPIYVQNTIMGLRKNQFGYSGFGAFPVNNYLRGCDESFMHRR